MNRATLTIKHSGFVKATAEKIYHNRKVEMYTGLLNKCLAEFLASHDKNEIPGLDYEIKEMDETGGNALRSNALV